jgi:hypothetical protein
MVAMADARHVGDMSMAVALPVVCVAPEPPMWLGASMAGMSPLSSYLYMLHGTVGLPGDVFADVECGRIEVSLVLPESIRSVRVACLRTGFADVRVRIPIKCEWGTQAIAIPVDRIAADGLIRGVTVQTGATVDKAMRSPNVLRTAMSQLVGDGIVLRGRHYQSTNAVTRNLVVQVPRFSDPVAIVSLTLQTLGDARVLALADTADE